MPASTKFGNRPVLWFLLGGFVFLYLELFMLPYTSVLADGDQTIFLHDAMRMLEGQVIYRDFFQFTLPGTQLVYLALLKLFGLRAWIPNAMVILLGVSLTWLSMVVSSKLVDGACAFLPGLLFLTFVFRNPLDGTHHWYSTLAVMAALAVLIENRSTACLAAAGALCGLATCFTQTRGLVAVLGFAVFLLWERHQKGERWRWLLLREGCLFATFLATVGAFNAYFVWKVGLGRFLDCTVTFVLKYYSAERWNNWKIYMTELPRFPPWSNLPQLAIRLLIHVLLPLIYVLFFVRYWREAGDHPEQPWDRVMLVNIAGSFLFLGIASSPSWLRLCSVSLPALILLVWFVRCPGNLELAVLRMLWVVALFLAIVEPLMRQHHWREYLDLPTGRTAFLDPNTYDRFQWMFRRTRRSDFFFEGPYAEIYFPLGLRNPTEVHYVTPTDYTRPEQVQNVIEGLEKHQVRFILWSTSLDFPDQMRPWGYHLGPLRAYMGNHYHVVKTFGESVQIWERKD